MIQADDAKPLKSKVGFYHPPERRRKSLRDSGNNTDYSFSSPLESSLQDGAFPSTPRAFFYSDNPLPSFSFPTTALSIYWKEKQLLRHNAVSVTFAGELIPPSGEGPVTVEVREWASTDVDMTRRCREVIKLFAAISHPFIIRCYGYKLTATPTALPPLPATASTTTNSIPESAGGVGGVFPIVNTSLSRGGSFGLSLEDGNETSTMYGLETTTIATTTGVRKHVPPTDMDRSLGSSSSNSTSAHLSSRASPTTAAPALSVLRYRLEMFFEVCGVTLDQWLQAHPKGLSIYVVRDLTRQLLEALSHLHLKGILHGDVNPENIVFSSPAHTPERNESLCVIKLADFSNFRNIVEKGWCKDFRGTFSYMAPEIFHGSKLYGSRVDVWALGCTVLAMLGRKPWGNEVSYAPSLCIEVLRHPGCMPHGMPLQSECPFMLYDFLQGCFQWDPDARPSVDILLVHPWITAEKQSLIEIPREEEHGLYKQH